MMVSPRFLPRMINVPDKICRDNQNTHILRSVTFFENRAANLKGATPLCIVNYFISAVNTQHTQRPDVLVQLGYIWQHVSAFNRPSSGQQGIVLLRYTLKILF